MPMDSSEKKAKLTLLEEDYEINQKAIEKNKDELTELAWQINKSDQEVMRLVQDAWQGEEANKFLSDYSDDMQESKREFNKEMDELEIKQSELKSQLAKDYDSIEHEEESGDE